MTSITCPVCGHGRLTLDADASPESTVGCECFDEIENQFYGHDLAGPNWFRLDVLEQAAQAAEIASQHDLAGEYERW